MCINCGEMVQAAAVTEHSRHCQQVHPYLSHMEESECLRLLDFKIEKLRMAMLTSLLPGFTPLTEVATSLLKTYGVSELALSQAQQAQRTLSNFLSSHKGSSTISLYAERLKSLACDKANELQRILTLHQQDFTRQMTDKDSEIAKLRQEIEGLRRQPSPPPRESEEIKRETENSRAVNRAKTSVSPGNPVSAPKYSPADFATMSDTDRQRYFFSQCLAIKLTFSGKSKAQYVKIPQLYEKAKEENVAIEEWPNFIRNELERAS